MMQAYLIFNSATELVRSDKNNSDSKNSSICLLPAVSKTSNPQHNIHTIQIKVLEGNEYGDFHALIGLSHENNLPMLK